MDLKILAIDCIDICPDIGLKVVACCIVLPRYVNVQISLFCMGLERADGVTRKLAHLMHEKAYLIN